MIHSRADSKRSAHLLVLTFIVFSSGSLSSQTLTTSGYTVVGDSSLRTFTYENTSGARFDLVLDTMDQLKAVEGRIKDYRLIYDRYGDGSYSILSCNYELDTQCIRLHISSKGEILSIQVYEVCDKNSRTIDSTLCGDGLRSKGPNYTYQNGKVVRVEYFEGGLIRQSIEWSDDWRTVNDYDDVGTLVRYSAYHFGELAIEKTYIGRNEWIRTYNEKGELLYEKRNPF